MFYNVLNEAMSQGLSVSDVFGDQSGFYRHALIECASYCDSIFAVGDPVVEELRFLGPAFADLPIELVYNGVPAFEVTPAEKKVSVRRMQDYTQELVGFVPDIVFTHVTRLVMSKGLWRDTLVLEHLDRRFSAEGLRGVYYILSSTGGTRSTEDVHRMEAEYGWPAVHREGYPDLVGPEVGLWQMIEDFNRRAQAIRVVFVNQFGWSQDRCGKRMPAEMGLMDLRKASHVEFGQSIYEPFGIAHVEPLSFGALCVVSSVCGCCGYVRRASGQEDFPNLVVADYTALPETQSLEEVLHIGKEARDRLEGQVTSVVAEKVMDLLPRTEKGSAAAVQRGYVVAHKMSWERVCQDLFLPALDRACHSSRVSKKER